MEYFIHHENPDISSLAIDLTTFPYTIADWHKKHDILVPNEEDTLKATVEKVIYAFKIKHIMKIISETQKQLQNATSDDDILTLVAQKRSLDEVKNRLTKELGWVVTR